MSVTAVLLLLDGGGASVMRIGACMTIMMIYSSICTVTPLNTNFLQQGRNQKLFILVAAFQGTGEIHAESNGNDTEKVSKCLLSPHILLIGIGHCHHRRNLASRVLMDMARTEKLSLEDLLSEQGSDSSRF